MTRPENPRKLYHIMLPAVKKINIMLLRDILLYIILLCSVWKAYFLLMIVAKCALMLWKELNN